MNIAKNNSTRTFVLLTISLYLLLNAVSLVHHEPWRNEAQAWLIARDMDLPSMIFTQMGYEGTPALWHVLLVPFAKTGFPYITASIIHLIIATAAVYVFLLRAPFSRAMKLLFVFSYYMGYQYSVVVRNYNISILLLFLIAAFYGSRFRRPFVYALLVFLLFNTNVFVLSAAGGLVCLFVWELRSEREIGRAGYAATGVMCLGALLALVQLWPPADGVAGGAILSPPGPGKVFRAVEMAFFVAPGEFYTYTAAALVIFTLALLSIGRKPAVLFVALASYLGLFGIFMLRHGGFGRHYGFVLVILIFLLWLSSYYKNPGRPQLSVAAFTLINFCLLISVVFCLKRHYIEYHCLYSGGKDMANFITENGLEDHTISAHMVAPTSSLLPYLPGKKFWYAAIGDYGTYNIGDKKHVDNRFIEPSEVTERTRKRFAGKTDVLLLLSDRSLRGSDLEDFELLHQTPETDRQRFRGRATRHMCAPQEKHFLYRYKGSE